MMSSVLSTYDLSVGYRKGSIESIVLKHLNLSLPEGQLVSLLGANGAGKSTLLRTLSGVQPALSGGVEINGMNISKYTNAGLSKLVSIVTTERTSAGGLTVRELVGLGRQPYTGFLGRLSSDDREFVSNAIESVGITHKADCNVAELSDGERQKVMIAKALAQQTPVIILDEPTAFLDVASRIGILQLLHELTRKERKAILMSTHDISQSIALSDRLWLLNSTGEIIDESTEDAVADGYMDCLFAAENICFDILSCDYSYLSKGKNSVRVNGFSPELTHLCKNALRRNGFNVVDDADLVIDVDCNKRILIKKTNYNKQVSSFSEMIDEILSINN